LRSIRQGYQSRAAVLGTMAIIFVASCGKQESPAEKPAAVAQAPANAPAPAVSTQSGTGTIRGEVVYKGKVVPASLTVNKDQEVCGKNKTDPSLVVSPEGKLQNAVISVAAPAGSAAPAATKVVLDQKGCEYHPHVLALTAGSTVEILNPDGILHNVHSYSKVNSPFNLAQPKFKKSMTVTIEKAEIIQAKCDVHSWMNGWLFVSDTPYFAVSNESGGFQLTGLPAGDHEVEIWHEKLGKQRKTVKLGANETATVTFEFSGS
jgi:plastocyanin